MNKQEILTIVNQVIGGKTTALEVIDSGRIVEVVVSEPCNITLQDQADFDAHGLHFVDYTTAYKMADDPELGTGITIMPCFMFRILE